MSSHGLGTTGCGQESEHNGAVTVFTGNGDGAEQPGDDPGHGPRAADTLATLIGVLFTLDPERLALLEQAIRHHTDGATSTDPTIGTCWDADRLDLGRVGKRPEARFMSTGAGKQAAECG